MTGNYLKTGIISSMQSWQAFIREKAIRQRIKWSRHALNEISVEPVSVADVEIALQEADIIESYEPDHRYLPDCLVLTFVMGKAPIHCVIGINQAQDYILVVTVYRPDPEEWQDDWRTRR